MTMKKKTVQIDILLEDIIEEYGGPLAIMYRTEVYFMLKCPEGAI